MNTSLHALNKGISNKVKVAMQIFILKRTKKNMIIVKRDHKSDCAVLLWVPYFPCP